MRQFTLIPAFIFLAMLSMESPLFAQRGAVPLLGGGGPQQFGVRYDYFDPGISHQITAEFSRSRPLGMRPGASPLSYFTSLNLAAGLRFLTQADSSKFVWRIGLFDGEFQRSLWVLGLTIVDLNRSGPLSRDFRWVNGRIGPGLTIGNRRWGISPQMVGTIGFSSVILGRENYNHAGILTDSTFAGLDAGFRTAVAVRIGTRLLLAGKYQERLVVNGPEPHFKTLGAEVRLRFGKLRGNALSFTASFAREQLDFNNAGGEVENRFFQVGLRLSRAGRRPPSPWDELD